jgi:hypothetical protein
MTQQGGSDGRRRSPWTPIFNVTRKRGAITTGWSPIGSTALYCDDFTGDWPGDWVEHYWDGSAWVEGETSFASEGEGSVGVVQYNSQPAIQVARWSNTIAGDQYVELGSATSSFSSFGISLGPGFGVAAKMAADASSFYAFVIREGSSGATPDRVALQKVEGGTVTGLADVVTGNVNGVYLRLTVIGADLTGFAIVQGVEYTLTYTDGSPLTDDYVGLAATGTGIIDSPAASGSDWCSGRPLVVP